MKAIFHNYHYTTADGWTFDTPSECRAHYRAVMKENGVASRSFKGARWHYRKVYDDARKPAIFYKTNGRTAYIVNPIK